MENNDIFNIKLNIDTSSLTNTEVSPELFNEGIEEKVGNILKKAFPTERSKQYIKHTTMGLNFACPICGDSATDYHKRRGNILLHGRHAGLYKCFNCGASLSIQKFFKEFDTDLSLADVTYINKNLKNEYNPDVNTVSTQITASIVDTEEAYKWAIDREYIKNTLGLKEIGRESTPVAWNYLIGRCQYKNMERFLYYEKSNQILILNIIKDRVLGMQIRNLNYTGNGPKYLTMTIDKMREALLGDKTTIPDNIANLSCIFNIFNVDFMHTNNMPVLVAEGPFDAFLLPNCIALSGAAKNFSLQFPFWYVFDDDDTGREHAMEKLKQSYHVFQWKKFKQDYGIPTKNPYITNGNRYKWDTTDIMKYLRDNNITKKLYWSPYFTNSMLAGLNI